MKKAIHAATGKRVLAKDVCYNNYSGLFICPYCKETLRLTTAHARQSKNAVDYQVESFFVHQNQESKRACPHRVEVPEKVIPTVAGPIASLSRGQILALLEDNLAAILEFAPVIDISSCPFRSDRNSLYDALDAFKKTAKKEGIYEKFKRYQEGLVHLYLRLLTDERGKFYIDKKVATVEKWLEEQEQTNYANRHPNLGDCELWDWSNLDSKAQARISRYVFEHLLYGARKRLREKVFNLIVDDYCYKQIWVKRQYSVKQIKQMIQWLDSNNFTKAFYRQTRSIKPYEYNGSISCLPENQYKTLFKVFDDISSIVVKAISNIPWQVTLNPYAIDVFSAKQP